MKKTIFATLLCLFLCGSLFAQQQQVTVHGGKAALGQVLSEIESQTGMSVDFDNQEVDTAKTVSVPDGTYDVKALLDAVLEGPGYAYTIRGSHIIIKAKKAPQKQTQLVSGKVVDSKGEPVIGAAVLVKGTMTGTTTEVDGSFSIGAAGNAILVISSMGYTDAEVAVQNRSVVNVVLEEDALFLEDAVVVGYGVQKKENLTGAISVISSDAIQNRSNSNLGGILQGTVPGLTITSPSGRPGDDVSINIRGWNSINGGSPLVLIDGVLGSLDKVNPNDVESISVLKDASAAAVYGAKAGYGVILVTTKSGGDNDGHAKVRFSSRLGFSTPTTSTDWETRGYYSVYLANLFMNAYNGNQQILYNENDMEQLWLRRNDKVENPERPWVIIDQTQGRNTYKYYANTDWWHVFFNDRKPMQNHSISFTGGTKSIKYFFSGSFDQEQGVFRQNPDTFKKFNLRSRISFDVNKWMNISNNTAYYVSLYNYPGLSSQDATFYQLTAGYFPFLPAQNPDGTYIYQTDLGGGGQSISGNLANEFFKNKNRENTFTNTTEITITPIKKLEIKANYTYSYNSAADLHRAVNGTFSSKIPLMTETLTTGDNEDKLNELFQSFDTHTANAYATYTDKFADAHNLKVMAGANVETYYHKRNTLDGYELLSQNLNDQNLVGGKEEGIKADTGGKQSEYALLGFFGRINYDYKGKYLLELSGRYDGSSRFPRGQRFGFFPSFSLGWRVSEEKFFSPLKNWWNDLKVRFSYGSLGNQVVSSYYPYIRTVSLGTQNYLFGSNKSTVAKYSDPVASDMTWETVNQKDLGIDLALFGNKITFSGDAYIRETKKMLVLGKPLPASYGAEPPLTNNAELRSKGYELSLTYRNSVSVFGKPLDYSATATFNDYIGFITKYNNPTKNLSSPGYYVGMRNGEIWGYTTDGFFASDEEARNYPVDQSPVCQIIYSSAGEEHGLRAGDLKYVDLDGDGVIGSGANTVDKPGDRKIIGNSEPRYQYGLNLGFNWAGFDFSVFFQGIGKINWYPSGDARYFWGLYARPFSSWIQKDFYKSYWTEENPDAYFPRPRAYVAMKDGRELGTVNDRYLQNLGYCRLKNLTFGYTLPKKFTEKIDIESVRFYFSGENLAYWAPGFHCDYIDPEAAARTKGKTPIYPWQKTFMFGIDINF